MNLITDLFTYFSKFATKEAVLRNFKKSSGASYDELKSQFDNHQNVLDFNTFIFGHDVKFLLEQIGSAKDYFLFIEYLQVKNTAGVANNHDLRVSVAVGRKIDGKTIDSITTAISMDNCLEQLKNIASEMTADKREQKTKLIIGNSSFEPFDTMDVPGAIGWSFECNQNIAAIWD
jgi:hypothetical protein